MEYRKSIKNFKKYFQIIRGFILLKYESNISKGYGSKLYRFGYFKNIVIGNCSYIAPWSRAINVEIGNFTSIGSHFSVGSSEHDYAENSMSPVFSHKKNATSISLLAESKKTLTKQTIIGHDVWIGTKVYVKSGVKIGNGAVIGACSVVTKDVEPYSVNVGNPARKIKSRFGNKDIKLIKTDYYKWTEFDLKMKFKEI